MKVTFLLICILFSLSAFAGDQHSNETEGLIAKAGLLGKIVLDNNYIYYRIDLNDPLIAGAVTVTSAKALCSYIDQQRKYLGPDQVKFYENICIPNRNRLK